MKLPLRLATLVTLMLMAAACDMTYGPEYLADGNPAKVRGHVWKWVGYTTMNGGYFTDVPASSSFQIDDSTVAGGSGCNRFQGKCRLDRSLMTFDDVFTTLLGCEGVKDYICQLTEGPIQYHQRDSLLVLVPPAGEMVHLFFRMQ